jgi:tripartite-type tricarboxylate transporter receptor subunit TctC
VNELIAWLKTNQGKATAGIGAAGFHLLTALLQKEIQARITLVPYRGEAPASQDLLAGRIDFLFASPVQLPLLRSGMIKALASKVRMVRRSRQSGRTPRKEAPPSG